MHASPVRAGFHAKGGGNEGASGPDCGVPAMRASESFVSATSAAPVLQSMEPDIRRVSLPVSLPLSTKAELASEDPAPADAETDPDTCSAKPTPVEESAAVGPTPAPAEGPFGRGPRTQRASHVSGDVPPLPPTGMSRALTSCFPTNYDMLLFRTANMDLGRPNASQDHVASKFRDSLMPVRAWLRPCFGDRLLRCFLNMSEDPRRGCPGTANFIDARTQWLDDVVGRALDGGVRQVLILAAGYDTRAYRLHRPGVRFFEVDLPSSVRKKVHLVARCIPDFAGAGDVRWVAADLSEVKLQPTLATAGFDPRLPTCVTIEGLVYYLPDRAVRELLCQVADLMAPGSTLAMDFLNLDALRKEKPYVGFEACAQAVANKGEPFVSGISNRPADLADFFATAGLACTKVLSADDIVDRYLPHETERRRLGETVINPFYSYAEAAKLPPAMSRV